MDLGALAGVKEIERTEMEKLTIAIKAMGA